MKNILPIVAALAISTTAFSAEPPTNLPIGSRDGVIYRVSDLQTSTVENQVSITAGATNTINAAIAPVQLISLGTNTTFLFSNLASDLSFKVVLYNPTALTNTIVFPTGINWTENPVTNLLNTKRTVIEFISTGTIASNLVATVHRQP
jgi:hypothetical protein